MKFAEQMEDDGEPLVDLNYFKMLVAKAILWRSAEKLFDTLDLDGYRANSVAYAVAWLTEKSGWCVDLMGIWEKQRLTTALSDVLKTGCKAAWEYLTDQDGNVGEASKKQECWQHFRDKEIEVSEAWRAELLAAPVETPKSEEEALAAEWERVRHRFIQDARTMEALEAYTNREWIATRRRDLISHYAAMSWEKLRAQPRFGLVKIRRLVEMLGIAAQG